MTKGLEHVANEGKNPSPSHFQHFTLSNGVKMPQLGLGMSHKGGYSHSSLVYAFRDCGYRLIDTAVRYNNEDKIGAAIKESGVPRHEMFITTKIWPAQYGYENVIADFHKSCKRLSVDYIDLYLMHWPDCPTECKNKSKLRSDTWRAMEHLYREGLCRAIGVSNFEVSHLEEFLPDCSIIPHVNQCEYHPFWNPKQLVDYCKCKGIQFEGYSPLAKATILKEKPILSIAQRNSCTPAQVLLRWCIQNGVVAIPKSTNKDRIKENTKVFTFTLSEADMSTLDSLHTGYRIINPDLVQEKVDASYHQFLLQQREESCAKELLSVRTFQPQLTSS